MAARIQHFCPDRKIRSLYNPREHDTIPPGISGTRRKRTLYKHKARLHVLSDNIFGKHSGRKSRPKQGDRKILQMGSALTSRHRRHPRGTRPDSLITVPRTTGKKHSKRPRLPVESGLVAPAPRQGLARCRRTDILHLKLRLRSDTDIRKLSEKKRRRSPLRPYRKCDK